MQGAHRTALRAHRNFPRAPFPAAMSRILENNVTDSGNLPRQLPPRRGKSHQRRKKSHTAPRAASWRLSARAVFLPRASTVFLAALILAIFAAAPAWATNNQLFMTGTGTGNTPVIYTNGVDSNINMALMMKGTGSVGIDNTSPGALLDVGLAGTTTGTLRLEGITSGYVQVQPSAAAGSWVMTLPTGVPASNGYVLSSTTAGVTSWVANGSSVALSSVTSATGVNTIDNTNNAQTWQWGTLTTGTAMSFTTSSMTTGTLLSLQDTAVAATSTGKVLSISDTTTGPGYGVYSAMTGVANTGYAGYYFNNANTGAGYALYATTSTNGTGYGVYGNITGTGNTGYGGFFKNTANSGLNYGVAAQISSSTDNAVAGNFYSGGNGNTGGIYTESASTANGFGIEAIASGQGNTSKAGYFGNTSTTGVNYGVYGTNASTGAGYGVYGTITGSANTGYAGYFTNTATTGVNYGVYGNSASNTGVEGVGGFIGVYGYTPSTGSGYGVYGTITGHANTGYAGYFINTDTSSTAHNYGGYFESDNSGNYADGSGSAIYAINTNTGNSNQAIFATNATNGAGAGIVGQLSSSAATTGAAVYGNTLSTGVGYGVYGTITGHGNTGYAGYFTNTDTSSNLNYGVYGITLSTNGNSAGVFGECDNLNCQGVYGQSTNGIGVVGNSNDWGMLGIGAIGVKGLAAGGSTNIGVEGSQSNNPNTGYAGYFANTDTASVSYGIYGTDASSSGFGVYGNNSSTGAGVFGQSGFNGIAVQGFSPGGTGYAGYFYYNGNGGGYAVYGISGNAGNTGYAGYFTSTGTATSYGTYSSVTGTANTGYAGYFTNTATTGVNYGIYAKAASTNASAYAGYFSGNIFISGTITMTSDRRAKKNIEALDTEDALDEIASLRPVSFTWKKNGAPDMGLIAQEVDGVYPDLIVHGAGDSLALKYVSLIAPMIASIQELKERNDDIEAEDAALRRDFETYKETHP
jgi:hypothetical protein